MKPLRKEAPGWREKGIWANLPLSGEPSLLPASKQRVKELAHQGWAKSWKSDKEGDELKRFAAYPNKNTAKLKSLKKVVSSVITRLRTKIALRDLLFVYGVKNYPMCKYRRSRQIGDHILLSCPRYNVDRLRTWGNAPMDIETILTTKDLAVKAPKFMRGHVY